MFFTRRPTGHLAVVEQLQPLPRVHHHLQLAAHGVQILVIRGLGLCNSFTVAWAVVPSLLAADVPEQLAQEGLPATTADVLAPGSESSCFFSELPPLFL